MKYFPIFAWCVLLSVAIVVPWWQHDVMRRAEEISSVRIEHLQRQIVETRMTISTLELAICHEVNMRSVRPSERLSAKQCMQFIDTVAKDARTETDPGKGLTWMLTPSPTACPPLDQYCQRMRENR